MTMHIFFNTDKDGYKKDQSCYVERSLARRFCENGVAIPYQQHIDNVYDADQAEKKSKEAEKSKKEKADEEKKAALLREKADEETENADSKKTKRSEKSEKK